MSRQYRDVGVVLRTYKLGEADRIVVLLTREHGKVRAVAHGVRRTNSKIGARLEPTSHVTLLLRQGRSELQTVGQVELYEHFPELRADLDRLGRASAMLEVIDQVAREGEPTPDLYEMLLGGLRAVERRDSPLVVAAFYLKLLAADGVGLQVEACIECGEDGDLVAVDLAAGGACCGAHRRGQGLSDEAMILLQAVLGGRMVWALEQPVSAATWEVEHLAAAAMETHLDRRLRAVRMLEHR